MIRKSYKVRFSPRAERDLREYWRHIAEDNVLAADKFLDLIESKAQSLSELPKRGALRRELGAGLRMLVAGKYLIFYLVVDGVVQIVRVTHGAADLKAIFSPTTI